MPRLCFRTVLFAGVLAVVVGSTTAARAQDQPPETKPAIKARAPGWHELVKNACFRRVDDVAQLGKQVEFCRHVAATIVTPANKSQIIKDVSKIGVDPGFAEEAVRNASAAATEKAEAAGADVEAEAAIVAAAATEAKNKEAEVPSMPLSTNWSLTVETYVGLLRVIFGSKALGTSDRFSSLSGAGSGVKFRYSRLLPESQKTIEIIGLSLGLYYEPDLKTASPTNPGTTQSAQALSVMFMMSTFQHVYAGVGWKFASTEPGYEHGFDQATNWMFVFGVGLDGKSL